MEGELLLVGVCGVQDLDLVFYCMNSMISGFSRVGRGSRHPHSQPLELLCINSLSFDTPIF